MLGSLCGGYVWRNSCCQQFLNWIGGYELLTRNGFLLVLVCHEAVIFGRKGSRYYYSGDCAMRINWLWDKLILTLCTLIGGAHWDFVLYVGLQFGI